MLVGEETSTTAEPLPREAVNETISCGPRVIGVTPPDSASTRCRFWMPFSVVETMTPRPSAVQIGSDGSDPLGARWSPVRPPATSRSYRAVRLRGVLPGVMALTNRSGWSYERTGVVFKTPRNVTLLPSGLNTGLPMVPSMLAIFVSRPPVASAR